MDNFTIDNMNFTPGEVLSMQPLALAFIGDAVYEIYIRNYVMKKGFRTINSMHVEAIKYVKAASQSKAVKILLNELEPEEANVVRRGRNANPHTVPKNADVGDYRYATGFESLCGYLYLMKKQERLEYLIGRVIGIINGEI
ncbi:MAG: Mini-ribonuclease 3 [Ruminococcaceae bacterium]|nr:Mini-ribonuclease 3 [Oscillospiraceae bacterium]